MFGVMSNMVTSQVATIYGRGSLMRYSTFIGLDVHARSISAAALDPLTGEITSKRFGYAPTDLAAWISSFPNPVSVYESGVTGFHLARELKDMGIECKIAATSKLMRPVADAKKKNDTTDAIFLARALSMGNIEEVFVPDTETEAARDLVRAYEDCRKNLHAARQRMVKFLMRHGYVWNKRNEMGEIKTTWTRDHWAWLSDITFKHASDQEAYDYYYAEVKHLEGTLKALKRDIEHLSSQPRFKGRVEALSCLKGIETLTAFALTAEIGVFSRFESAKSFSSYTGLAPSEHSSGEHRANGPIAKTGNTFVRRLLVESAWHYLRASEARKKVSEGVPLPIQNHAARGIKRLVRQRKHLVYDQGKRAVVANVATARELAGFVWAIGRMAEGAL